MIKVAPRFPETPTSQPPLVSALLPSYNAAEFIQKTLDSLAAQTWPNLEILIGDDCSTDITPGILSEFAKTRANVRILQRNVNLGWLANSNDLMANARGELMFFAFHDDVLCLDYVERLAGALRANPQAILAFSDLELFTLQGDSSVKQFLKLEKRHSALSRSWTMAGHPAEWWVPNRGLFRARAFAATGGIRPNAKGEYSADWTWLLHLSLLGDFVRVPTVLVHKHYQTTSLSKTWPHDRAQKIALAQAGIHEIWRSKAGILVKIAATIQIATRDQRSLIKAKFRRLKAWKWR